MIISRFNQKNSIISQEKPGKIDVAVGSGERCLG